MLGLYHEEHFEGYSLLEFTAYYSNNKYTFVIVMNDFCFPRSKRQKKKRTKEGNNNDTCTGHCCTCNSTHLQLYLQFYIVAHLVPLLREIAH